DLVVVGGGLAGTCCAITAARAGVRVALVQDRPVLGGNASSEIRMVALGATASRANNNRWAREGGVIDEFLLENVYRNPEGNPLLGDVLLLDMVLTEPRITLLLNTAVFDVVKRDASTIASIRAFCSQNETFYEIEAPLFCDASGDGIVGYLAGATFRMGAESADEFDEPLAPDAAYGELLGHSIYFQTKDIGRPVPFVRPRFALEDVTKITRLERVNAGTQGRDLWWLEYGGRLDTIHDAETIKWDLWRIVYGVWDYIKNSGKFPEAQTRTLEWVGTVPGKRESRRFEGDYILSQRDLVDRQRHDDAVSYGGWSIDLHPADGLYSPHPPCTQWHAKGIYSIPYRSLYSRNIANLFLAGRIISASHVAFSSTRVMATCAHNAQAVGVAAAVCLRENALPANLAAGGRLAQLRLELARTGQYIPGYTLVDPDDLARRATITATSQLRLSALPPDGALHRLECPRAALLPVPAGPVPRVAFHFDADRNTQLTVSLRTGCQPDSYTPEQTLATRTVDVPAGTDQTVWVDFGVSIDTARYVFVCLGKNLDLSVRGSRRLVTGLMSVVHRGRVDVTIGAVQTPEPGLGVESFEFWPSLPDGQRENLALQLDPPLDLFGPESVVNGVARPTCGPNAWVADPTDARPVLTLRWTKPQTIARIELVFDTDQDNPLFSTQYLHAQRIMPQCIRQYRVLDAQGQELACSEENRQTRNTICLTPPVETDTLQFELTSPSEHAPAALHELRCYGPRADEV
ncbi:MAG: FAD-dependent oxidoreductase, partial [Sedimentisphaerales bacterium]|nr:FAD-dependent oxidoreductase [Sedimentisphaerales bacterium]